MPLITCVINLTRVIDVLYKGKDHFTYVGEELKGLIKSLFIDPLSALLGLHDAWEIFKKGYKEIENEGLLSAAQKRDVHKARKEHQSAFTLIIYQCLDDVESEKVANQPLPKMHVRFFYIHLKALRRDENLELSEVMVPSVVEGEEKEGKTYKSRKKIRTKILMYYGCNHYREQTSNMLHDSAMCNRTSYS
ncbi:hypothetical protein OSB04_016727 [Centaurea solstitialis]|uniref:Uncharacterized protein n=1 Tax=Centaurea solstitialis TaxID=347529 RepID=A0AA38W8S3_9ASTR|nr:hypothetical protein OSB04_016727 [Centaurea solstitialis]